MIKKSLLTVALLAAVHLGAQPALSPSAPAISATPSAPALVPSSPILTPTTPAITNPSTTPVIVGTNLAAAIGSTNLTLIGLTSLLTNLQDVVAATLPPLAAFNDSFNFLSTGAALTVNGTIAATTTNFGLPFGVSAGTSTNLPATNVFGLAPNLVASPAARDTLRALLVLQNDLQRLLPLLDALNGGTNFPGTEPTPGFVPQPFTNLFGPLVPGP